LVLGEEGEGRDGQLIGKSAAGKREAKMKRKALRVSFVLSIVRKYRKYTSGQSKDLLNLDLPARSLCRDPSFNPLILPVI
jgi:hypothetical protein